MRDRQAPRTELGPDQVDAWPTKRLFIEMLTRDIPLVDAIVDLVDNAIDAALRLRPDKRFDGLEAHLTVQPERFEIKDNCGGMGIDTARHYAFRFGRDKEHTPTPGAVGQFGVGMKRAIFKIGKYFRVTSATSAERFVLAQDVDVWENSPDWFFEFDEMEEGIAVEPVDQGTCVTVIRLAPDVASTFAQQAWLSRLSAVLAARLRESLANDFLLTLNGVPIEAHGVLVLSSLDLAPSRHTDEWNGSDVPISIQVVCGLGPPKRPQEAGWYVHCNGRTIIEADRTPLTGWGAREDDVIPAFHPQYARFRGFVYLFSESPERLPWNTTKTGVDPESAVFLKTRILMRQRMKPVISFLNRVAEERRARRAAEDSDPGPLEGLMAASPATPASRARLREEFEVTAPTPPEPVVPQARIQFSRPKDLVTRIMRAARVRTYKELGERAFDYFVLNEFEEEE